MDNEPQAAPGEQKPEPARPITVQVSSDRMTAFVSVRGGVAAGEQELLRALESAAVHACVAEDAFARLALGLQDRAFEISRELIARGKEVQQGDRGRFESPFLEGPKAGHLREDGTIDFHDRELLKPVQKGDLIGQVWPARPGVAGQLVDGTVVAPVPVQEAVVALGPGVVREASGAVLAARAGIVLCKTPQDVDVIDEHIHNGPVDLHSGHLQMLGSLVVKGDVQRTFSVYATGNVEIRGSVDNGNVYAGGNVRIHQGVRGGSGTTVCAEGDLTVQRAESGLLYAGRLLQVGEALHSELMASRVEVSGKMRGGHASAEFSVVVQEAGAPHTIETELAVAEPLELPVEAARRDLEQAKAGRGKSIAAGPPRSGLLDRGKGGKGGKVSRANAALKEAEAARLAQRERRREELCRVAFVQVGVAHAGVTVRIGAQKRLIDQVMRASRFYLDAETREIRVDRSPA